MSLEEVQVSSLIPASPNAIYAAWMDSRRHSAITGSVAVINPWVGGRVTARARFIEATHVKLETGKRILLAWRTQDFPPDAPDSTVDVLLQPAAGGTKVSIQHSQIPAGHSAAAREIWRTLYLDPMKKYFGKTGAMEAAHRAATRAGQMPTADMVGMRHARTPITSAGTVSAPVVTGSPSDEPRDKPRRVILRKNKDGVILGKDGAPARPSRLVAAMAAMVASSGEKAKAAAAKVVGPSKGAPAKPAVPAKPASSVPAKPGVATPAKAVPAKPMAPAKAPPKPSPAKPAAVVKPGSAKAAPAKATAVSADAKKPEPAPAKPAPKKPAPKKPAPKKPAPKKPAPKKPAPKVAPKKPAPKVAPKKPAPPAKKPAPKAPAAKKPAPKAKVAPKPVAKKPVPKKPAKKAPAAKVKPAKKPAPKKGRR